MEPNDRISPYAAPVLEGNKGYILFSLFFVGFEQKSNSILRGFQQKSDSPFHVWMWGKIFLEADEDIE